MVDGQELINKKKAFEKTGKCKDHVMISSNKISTIEGKYTFHTCRVCNQAKVKVDGEWVQDELPKLINNIIKRGLKKEQKATNELNTLLGLTPVKEIPLDTLLGDL